MVRIVALPTALALLVLDELEEERVLEFEGVRDASEIVVVITFVSVLNATAVGQEVSIISFQTYIMFPYKLTIGVLGTPCQRPVLVLVALHRAGASLNLLSNSHSVDFLTAIGDKLAFAGVVAEVLNERDRAVGVEVAPKPIPEIEIVDGSGVFANGETRDNFTVGPVTAVHEVVERLEHSAVVIKESGRAVALRVR
ncbi:hypothetical protein, partial [Halorubrum sp. SD626R]|uniref:hypothetical protein n=1 Tax=Halorubrum sp. SD626R TaxID=1419722 RepID=UPI0018EEB5FB